MESEKVKEIKKALECCGMYKYDCEKCPYKSKGDDDDLTVDNGCGDLLLKDCLTLINELESEKDNLYNLNQNLISDKQVLMRDNERLKKDNELLRNAKVVYENVDYCYEDLKKAQDQIDKLEKENEILKGTKNRLTFVDRIELVNNAVEIQLKQFAERLKEKGKKATYIRKDNQFDLLEYFDDIDETLKEFIK